MDLKDMNVTASQMTDVVYADLIFDDITHTTCVKAFCVHEDEDQCSSILVTRPIDYGAAGAMIPGSRNMPCSSDDSGSDVSETLTELLGAEDSELCAARSDNVCTTKETLPSCTKKGSFNETLGSLECSGLQVLDNGRVLLSTRSGDIIVYSKFGRFLFRRQFGHQFEDIVQLSDFEMAATFGQFIKLYKVVQSDVHELKEKTIKLDVSVHGLCHLKGKFMVICNLPLLCTESKPYIAKLDRKGKISKTIRSSKLKCPNRITCTSDGMNVFISDKGRKSILCLSQDGVVRWELFQTSMPLDLVLLNENSLVVSFEKSLVVCFSRRGKIQGEIDATMGSSGAPCYMAYDKRRAVLFVCAEETNELRVPYALSMIEMKCASDRRISQMLTSE